MWLTTGTMPVWCGQERWTWPRRRESWLHWTSTTLLLQETGTGRYIKFAKKSLCILANERKCLNFQVLPEVPDSGSSPLEILFTFQRCRISHYIQTFLPSYLLVFISLMSLFVSSELVPGRMALAVTTMLTLTSMINSVSVDAPR